MSNDPQLRWAPKVRQNKIRQLYEQEARGLLDETLSLAQRAAVGR